MPANIQTYIGRQAAWHALGTVTGKYQTTDELLTDPGFQYLVLGIIYMATFAFSSQNLGARRILYLTTSV